MTTVPSDGLDRARLRALPLFAASSDADLGSILGRAAVVTARPGEAIVVEGDPSDYAYVVLAGATWVAQRGEELASLGPGDLFGETAMVAGGIRTATVRATTAVELLRLDAPSLAQTTGTQTIAWTMLQSLLDRIRDDDRRAEVDAAAPVGEYLTVAERVVVAPMVGVFRLCEPAQRCEPGGLLATGQVLGFIDALGEQAEVRSPFAGFFMGMLALEGERVRARQPIAWLRTL